MKSAREDKQAPKNNQGTSTTDSGAARQSDETDSNDHTTTIPPLNESQHQSSTTESPCTTSAAAVVASRDRKAAATSPDAEAANNSSTAVTIPGAVAITLLHQHNDINDDRTSGGLPTTGSRVTSTAVSDTRTATHRDAALDAPHENETGTPPIATAEEDESSTQSLGFAIPPPQQHNSMTLQEEMMSSPHLVQAELVVPTPTVQALFVSIDEEVEEPNQQQDREERGDVLQVAGYHHEDNDHDSFLKWHQRKGVRPLIIVSSILCCIVLTMSILIPLLIRDAADLIKRIEGVEASADDEDIIIDDYPCYRSTLDIARDQQSNPQPNDVYTICPNTRIQLGTFNDPENNEFFITNGDYPMTALGPGVTIQCGIDGIIENDCVIDGGFAQIMVLETLPPFSGRPEDSCDECQPVIAGPVDDFLVRGFTFTGSTISTGPFGGAFVSFSHPGRNVRFEECLWTDISTSIGLVQVHRNQFQISVGQDLPDESIDIAFVNCTFEKITQDFPLFYSESHSLTLQSVIIRDITLSLFAQDECQLDVDFEGESVYDPNGCGFLMYCGRKAKCKLDRVCLEDVEGSGSSLVVINNETQFSITESSWDGKQDDRVPGFCQVSTIVGESPACTSGNENRFRIAEAFGTGQCGRDEDQSSSSVTELPYDCYTSTRDLVRDQRDNPQPNDVYLLCPGTHIRLGKFKNPQANKFHIVDGDYPLTALRANVTIQCGLDGNLEDNCTLDGGFLQVLLQSLIPPLNEEEDDCVLQECELKTTDPVDNFLVRGITFTGLIDSGGPVTANSVTVSHPGENIRFENCLWKDMSVSNGLISVGYNYFQQIAGTPRFDNQSTNVTFVNCRFENIVYDYALFFIESQSITLEDCAFRDVEVSLFYQHPCTLQIPNSDPFLLAEGCAVLLYCGPGSRCSIDGMCLERSEAVRPSMIMGSDEAELVVSNSYWDGSNEWDATNTSCQVAVGNQQDDPECQVDIFQEDQENVASCTLRP